MCTYMGGGSNGVRDRSLIMGKGRGLNYNRKDGASEILPPKKVSEKSLSLRHNKF